MPPRIQLRKRKGRSTSTFIPKPETTVVRVRETTSGKIKIYGHKKGQKTLPVFREIRKQKRKQTELSRG